MIWGWIAGVLAVLVLLACSSFIHIRLRYRHIGRDDDLSLQVKALFGLVRFTYRTPVIRLNGGAPYLVSASGAGQGGQTKDVMLDLHKIRASLKRFRKIKAGTRGWKQWQRKTMRKLRCTRLSWYTRMGTRDAALTAVSVGTLWACKSIVVGWIANRIRMDVLPDLEVMPSFRQPTFQTELSVDGKMRLGWGLLAALELAYRIVRARGGPRAWVELLFAKRTSKSGPAAEPGTT